MTTTTKTATTTKTERFYRIHAAASGMEMGIYSTTLADDRAAILDVVRQMEREASVPADGAISEDDIWTCMSTTRLGLRGEVAGLLINPMPAPVAR